MNRAIFEEQLDVHGSDLAAWPEMLQVEARALLAQDPEAQALLDAQLTIDAHLANALTVPTSRGLEQKIMARFAAHKRRFSFSRWHTLIWKPAVAASCSLAFGFYLGAANQELPGDLAEDLTYVTFYDYEDWSGEAVDEP